MRRVATINLPQMRTNAALAKVKNLRSGLSALFSFGVDRSNGGFFAGLVPCPSMKSQFCRPTAHNSADRHYLNPVAEKAGSKSA